MKVSIIVPVYQVERYLRACIESVLCQTHREWELILVEDGSPDRCGVICDEYAKNDARITVMHKENGGLSSARNAGLCRATGEYILFLDGDDFWAGATRSLAVRSQRTNNKYRCLDNWQFDRWNDGVTP